MAGGQLVGHQEQHVRPFAHRAVTAPCSAASSERARSSPSSLRSSAVTYEKPVRSDGQPPCEEPPAPVWPKASGAGPSALGVPASS